MSTSETAPGPPHVPGGAHDVRLVVADMDGTLLDGHGRVPETLWPLLEELGAAGIVFVPASGRQYATLRAMFARAHRGMVFVAENGAYVVRDGVELSSTALPTVVVAEVVSTLRALARQGRDLGIVVCGKHSAYVERTDRVFREQVDPYYAEVREVADLLDVGEEVVKVAAFTFGRAEEDLAPGLEAFGAEHQVVVSNAHWVDVLCADVHKGHAVRRLQESLGVTPAQTVVFGDYLNDLEMLDAGELSFAMANAHPEVLARARHLAPANTEDGLVRTLRALLSGEGHGDPPRTSGALA